MNKDFLKYYNQELSYIHEKGKEFAELYPKIAGRLGMQGIEVADPYVERLMEGFSFLTARIRMKMDAEFPNFSQQILATVFPTFLSPIPSMSIAQIQPDLFSGNLKQGFVLTKGTRLRSKMLSKEKIACEFTTGDELNLLPLKINEINYSNEPLSYSLKHLDLSNQQTVSSLNIKFSLTAGVDLAKISFDKIKFFLNGQDVHTYSLLEFIMSHATAVICHDSSRNWIQKIEKQYVKHEGFNDEQSILPLDTQSFQGHRLLQEYFAFPEKFLFFSINNLSKVFQQVLSTDQTHQSNENKTATQKKIDSFELTILFDTVNQSLIGNISQQNILLNCVPIINLFDKHTDRIKVSRKYHEYHLVVDRTNPINYEVFKINKIIGYPLDNLSEGKEFKLLYQNYSEDEQNYGSYYTTHRTTRTISNELLKKGFRSEYIGSETFISLVDQYNSPYSEQLRVLAAEVMCSNRDLPRLLPIGSDQDLMLSVSAPVKGVKILKRPSKPKFPLGDGADAWKVINQLSINYQSLIEQDSEQGAIALHKMLEVYAQNNDALSKQIKGIKKITITPKYARIPVPGPMLYGRSVKLSLLLDDRFFAGISPYLFASVLAQFFRRHVSINSMLETEVSSLQKGFIARWLPEMGTRAII